MSDLSANLTLPYMAASQAQKHVTHNEALQILDAVVQLSVLARDQTDPPGGPEIGTRYIVPAGATGAWAGHGTQLALWTGSAWTYLDARPGWRAWVEAEDTQVVWMDGAWQVPPPPAFDNLPGVGVNTGADAVNRLAVASDATLLSHDGAGHQVKINKAAPGDTASLLFQSNWSGRAEMGLAGDDGWSVKVSPDGAAWTGALALDPATGLATGAAVQSGATDATAGRLMSVGAFGWGGDAPDMSTVSITDMNNLTVPGVWTVAGTVAHKPDGTTTTAGVCMVLRGSFAAGPRYTQILSYGATPTDPEIWIRVGTGDPATWTPWRQQFHHGNLLGTVAQSGGDPTGAVMERGSNANGEYAKFADGTMICTAREIAVDVTSAGNQSISYPVAFADKPSVAFSQASSSPNAALRFSNIEGFQAGTLAWNLNLLAAGTSTDPTALSEKMNFLAAGRWF